MQAKDIEVGEYYIATVNRQLTVVEVVGIKRAAPILLRHKSRIVYDVVNTATKRTLRFRSAARFRSKVLHNKCQWCNKEFMALDDKDVFCSASCQHMYCSGPTLTAAD